MYICIVIGEAMWFPLFSASKCAETRSDVVETTSDVVKIISDVVKTKSDVVKISPKLALKTSNFVNTF